MGSKSVSTRVPCMHQTLGGRLGDNNAGPSLGFSLAIFVTLDAFSLAFPVIEQRASQASAYIRFPQGYLTKMQSLWTLAQRSWFSKFLLLGTAGYWLRNWFLATYKPEHQSWLYPLSVLCF